MKKEKSAKKKKEKIVYIDDGSSIADLSGENRGRQGRGREKRSPELLSPNAGWREKLRTFTDAQKMMFLPMLAVLGIIALAFLIVYIIL